MRDFKALVAEAVRRPIDGWDFRFLDGRLVEDPLPWSYEDRARELVSAAEAPVLDLGTGGGEFLSGLAPLPPGSHATEGWAPNVPVARRRLAALAVDVVETGPFYLRMVPWQVPGFDADAYEEPLRRVHGEMAGGIPLTCTVHRFLVEAVRD